MRVGIYFPILYLYGVTPNFFLNSTIKCEQSENPHESQTSCTDRPLSSFIQASDSRLLVRYSRGEMPISALKCRSKVLILIQVFFAMSETLIFFSGFLFIYSAAAIISVSEQAFPRLITVPVFRQSISDKKSKAVWVQPFSACRRLRQSL